MPFKLFLALMVASFSPAADEFYEFEKEINLLSDDRPVPNQGVQPSQPSGDDGVEQPFVVFS